MNKLIIHGRLTKDPEAKQTGSGIDYTNFTVAVDRRFKSADGEKQTDFFYCTAWRESAKLIAERFRKGQEIVVEGSMESQKWVDNDGNNKTSWGVNVFNFDFCGSKKDCESEAGYPSTFAPADDEDDGNLPF